MKDLPRLLRPLKESYHGSFFHQIIFRKTTTTILNILKKKDFETRTLLFISLFFNTLKISTMTVSRECGPLFLFFCPKPISVYVKNISFYLIHIFVFSPDRSLFRLWRRSRLVKEILFLFVPPRDSCSFPILSHSSVLSEILSPRLLCVCPFSYTSDSD